jgi:hypothetical protein
MAGTITELQVAGKLALRAMARRLRSQVEPAPDLDQFQAGMEKLLMTAGDAVVRDHHWISMPAKQPPWVGSGVQLAAGDEVSYFTEGRVYANEFLDIYFSAPIQLWCRVGAQGEIFRGTRPSHSFVADSAGELQFGNYFPNDWRDRHGARKQGDEVYQQVSGELRILVIRWAQGVETGLAALRAAGDHQGRISAEQERLAQGDTTPPGWYYLWNVGPAEIYRAASREAGSCIHCHTRGDAGILQRDVDLPLTENTEISWRWCMEQLPSSIREDAVPSHDYLSIAVEFDNGRDITYYWSATLPEGTGYDCPLPNWQGIEYHVVIRSGSQGLGEWRDERRNLYRDYRQYMGEPPARITRVWLIANSLFQRGDGRCDYAGITLHGANGEISVL